MATAAKSSRQNQVDLFCKAFMSSLRYGQEQLVRETPGRPGDICFGRPATGIRMTDIKGLSLSAPFFRRGGFSGLYYLDSRV
jgi:hypothetical protein